MAEVGYVKVARLLDYDVPNTRVGYDVGKGMCAICRLMGLARVRLGYIDWRLKPYITPYGWDVGLLHLVAPVHIRVQLASSLRLRRANLRSIVLHQTSSAMKISLD